MKNEDAVSSEESYEQRRVWPWLLIEEDEGLARIEVPPLPKLHSISPEE